VEKLERRKLSARLFLLILFLLIVLPVTIGVESTSGQAASGSVPGLTSHVTHVFLVDTSLSMIGRGEGAVNIMPQVKESLKDFIESGKDTLIGSKVILATFSQGLLSYKEFKIQDEAGIKYLFSYIDGVQATGTSTYIYQSVTGLLDKIYKEPRGNEQVYVYLYTDGKEEESGRSISDTVQAFSAKKGSSDWLYYITLGVPLKEADRKALKETEGVKLVEVPSQNKPPIVIEMKIPRLNFGDISQKRTREQEFSLRTKRFSLKEDTTLSFQFKPIADIAYLAQKGSSVSVTPSEKRYSNRIELSLTVANPDLIPPGIYTAECAVTSSSGEYIVVPASFTAVFSKGDISYLLTISEAGQSKDENVSKIVVDKVWERGHESSYTMTLTPSALIQANSSKVTPPILTVSGEESGKRSLLEVQGQTGQITVPVLGGSQTITIKVPKDYRPGNYQPKIVFYSPDADIKGKGVKDIGGGMYEYSLTVQVNRKPQPPYVWVAAGLLLLILLATTALVITASVKNEPVSGVVAEVLAGTGLKKPAIRNAVISCSGPRQHRSSEYISLLTSQYIGQGTDIFPELPSRLHLQPCLFKGRLALRVAADEGVFHLRRTGEKSFMPKHEGLVWADDVIRVGDYQITIEASDLAFGGAYDETDEN